MIHLSGGAVPIVGMMTLALGTPGEQHSGATRWRWNCGSGPRTEIQCGQGGLTLSSLRLGSVRQ